MKTPRLFPLTPFARLLLWALFIVILAACGGGGGGGGGFPVAGIPISPPPAVAPAPVGACTVVIYGDSIMAGQGFKSYAAAHRPQWQVDDRSVPGTALLALATNFHAEPRSARFVVLENGAIDAWMGVPIGQVLALYNAMVDTIQAEGRRPIVTGFAHQRPGVLDGAALARRDDYDGALKTLMASRGVPFADFGSVTWDPAEIPDSIHPDAAYSSRLAARLLATLDALARECAP